MLLKQAILLIALIILSSCNSLKFDVHERKLIKIFDCEVNDENDSLCRVVCVSHSYDLNDIKRINESRWVNPDDCTDTIGFSVEAWTQDITPTMKALKKYYSK